jgi:hypothetical protein
MKEAIHTIANTFDLTGEETNEYIILERKTLEDGRMVDRTNRNRVIQGVEIYGMNWVE